ncbi:hypothetical protein DPMN_022397 [Dreissena polymorpha]|uniref:Uncharacterized protein n=1 Tax=Dreissena polymorpha TaxID=45954 RepID=A0A9D4NNT8_DREPO|nr:hypothetical protein DPMN_022397 [Dreissena polymorpha]
MGEGGIMWSGGYNRGGCMGGVYSAGGVVVIYIIGTNLLTKFHYDRKINVASRVLTNHVFQPTGIIFELFHEDRTVNVASRVHVFQANILIFKLIPDIIETNLLTKFHEDWTINVATRMKNATPPGGHVFKATKTIFQLNKDIIETNFLTKFHDDRKINGKMPRPRDWTINVASRVKNALPFGSHVFHANVNIFELIQDINKTNLLTIFHEDWTINVASRPYIIIKKPYKEKCPTPWQPKLTIFELIQDIIGSNLLSKCHEDRKRNVASRVLTRKNAPPPGGHVFQPTGIIFKLVQDIKGGHLLTLFHEDQTINVASRVLTRKNAPPLGSYVFQANVTIFELIQDIIETNFLTKFHEANVDDAQRTTHNGQKASTKAHHEHVVLRVKCDRQTDAQSANHRSAPGLVMGPCIVEIEHVNRCNFGWAWPMWARCPRIDRIVIRELQYQFEVNRCRTEEIIVKGNFGGLGLCGRGAPGLGMEPCIVESDCIVIKEVQHQFEVHQCRNEEIIVKGNFGWAWSMWAGSPRINHIVIREVQYQFEVNRCRNEEIIVKGNFGWAWPMYAWPMWAGRPRIIRIVIREVQYQLEDNRCRNEEIIIKIPNIVRRRKWPGRTDGRTTEIITISPFFLRKAWG